MKNMKYILVLLLPLATGCFKNIDETVDMPAGVRFVSNGDMPLAKVAVTASGSNYSLEWTSSDQVGIYGKGDVSGGNYAYNAIPDDGDAAKCSFVPAEKGRVFPYSDKAASYYAYRPFSANAGDAGPEAVIITVPSVQNQNAVNDMSHISDYYFMKAAPVTVTGEDVVNLSFKGIVSIVELQLKMISGTVSVSGLRLVSEGDDLAVDGTVDLTSSGDGISKVNGAKEVDLTLGTAASVTASAVRKFYFVVAPGSHPEGKLKLEVIATDNSVNTITLPAVKFEPNHNYVQSVMVDINEFVVSDHFAVNASSTKVGAGSSVEFTFTGNADEVVFWSGEEGHDYENRNNGGSVGADVTMSFLTYLQAGAQSAPLSLKSSTDFTGEATEAAILAATWKDISDRFTFCTDYSPQVSPANTDSFTPSGTGNVSDIFGEGNKAYLCFFYHVDAFDSGLNNGRTQAYVSGVNITSTLDGSTGVLYSQTQDNVTVIPGVSYDEDKTKPSISASYVRFTSTFKPTDVRNAYLLLPEIERATMSLSPDSGVALTDTEGKVPSGWSYTFAAPGTYHVVFVYKYTSVSGVKEEISEFTIEVV